MKDTSYVGEESNLSTEERRGRSRARHDDTAIATGGRSPATDPAPAIEAVKADYGTWTINRRRWLAALTPAQLRDAIGAASAPHGRPTNERRPAKNFDQQGPNVVPLRAYP